MILSVTFIATIVIVFFAVAFALANDQVVSVRLFGWTFKGSLVLVLLTAFCMGIIIQILVSLPAQLRRSQRLAALKQRVAELEDIPAPEEPPAPQEQEPVP